MRVKNLGPNPEIYSTGNKQKGIWFYRLARRGEATCSHFTPESDFTKRCGEVAAVILWSEFKPQDPIYCCFQHWSLQRRGTDMMKLQELRLKETPQ